MNYYLEFGGGLGDVIQQIFQDGRYAIFDELGPNDSAAVSLICHNPHAHELFSYHPHIDRIEIRSFGYWTPEEDCVMRPKHGLPRPPWYRPRKWAPKFYPAETDLPNLCGIPFQKVVVFSISAGLSERSVPAKIVGRLSSLATSLGFLPVFVGREYERQGRKETRIDLPGTLDLVNMLTVPGVAELVKKSCGVVCCHSSINILAWHLRVPQLLLYPPSVLERHISKRDQWAFGIDYPECVHGLFEDEDLESKANRFFLECKKKTLHLDSSINP